MPALANIHGCLYLNAVDVYEVYVSRDILVVLCTDGYRGMIRPMLGLILVNVMGLGI